MEKCKQMKDIYLVKLVIYLSFIFFYFCQHILTLKFVSIQKVFFLKNISCMRIRIK